MGAIQSVLGDSGALVPSRRVETKSGPVEGKRISIDEERSVDAFLGIPFTKPPIGPLRFQKPQPPESWTEVRKCVKFGPRAPQREFWWMKLLTFGVVKDEDCLHLNVFTPTWKPTEPAGFPVMVFIHGGGFVVHSADAYGITGTCKYLCRHDVVVVTLQYRLGLLGFFSTGDSVCPGNLGLWDQTEGLKWIRLNIKAFNGDPDRITVFGQSAGGVSTDLLTLSPHSRDLFQYAIPMAGNSHADWAVQPRSRLVATCRREAEKLGWHSQGLTAGSLEENAAMMDYLRTLPAERFGRLLNPQKGGDTILEYGPTIDGDFFPKSLEELRAESPARPYMAGTAEMEGLLFGLTKLLENVITEEKYGKRFRELIDEAKQIYLKDVSHGDKEAEAFAFCHLFGDLAMNIPMYKFAKERAVRGNTVYLYSFDQHHPKIVPLFLRFKFPIQAATHGTELTYVFGISLLNPSFKFDEHEMKVLNRTTAMFTNFAKFGNPNGPSSSLNSNDVQWEPVDAEHPHRFLSIASKCEMREQFANRRPEFWVKLEELQRDHLASKI